MRGGDAGGLAIDFLERSAASVDLLHLGVESGSHGQAGGWEARGQLDRFCKDYQVLQMICLADVQLTIYAILWQ